jgi:POT family proton-dependent oligopeptide transporter
MWEQFSFYGMQGILLIYLYYSVSDGGLGVEAGGRRIVGAYGGAVYLSTILGAWIADRLLGAERVLFGSAIVIMAGHIALALLPDSSASASGLVLVAIGSRLKATATSVVGTPTASTTRGATAASRCSTSASTSAPSPDRC